MPSALGSRARRAFVLSVSLSMTLSGCEPESAEETPLEPIDSLPPPGLQSSALAVGAPDERPNILMIVADDLGYSDIGAFGGEIRTPNLDQLARSGRLLTDHHAAAACSPTRAMLIAGTDPHLVGLGTMAELILPEHQGKPGYEGYLNDKALSIAELLRDGGYHTYITGKWHLGLTERQSPKRWGFESSFVLTQGAGTHFAPDPRRPTPADRESTFRENGVETSVPPSFYSTDFYTDKLIAYLEAHRGDGKPFFALAAYTAPHWPLQAPDDAIARYRGVYDAGYEVIRQQRIARQKQLGVIPADMRPHDPLPSTLDNPRWEALSTAQKRLEARRMEVYAAMVDRLDENVGKLIRYLESTGQYDNTFVFFQSDNGAEAVGSKFADGANVDNRYENVGRRYSNVAYGQRWAEVSAAPFSQFKGWPGEGGISVPAIVRLPKQRSAQAPFSGLTQTLDLAPTFLELARAAAPGTRYKGREVHPFTGRSILPVLAGQAGSLYGPDNITAGELGGRRYVRRGSWKLVWAEPPYGKGAWTLHDLSSDRAEQQDVSALHPEVTRALRDAWTDYTKRVGVVVPYLSRIVSFF